VSHFEIIVVGAGMAGLAAARTLQTAEFSVKILEGRDRIGGRTFTDSSLGVDVDLGAAWIHGPIGNPLTPLAQQFGVGTAATDFGNEQGDSILAFAGDGRRLDTAVYTRGSHLFHGAIGHLTGSILHPPPPPSCRSLADLYIHGLPGIDLNSLSETERLGYHFASVIRPQYEDAADLDLIDWRLSQTYMRLPGGDWLLPGGGYGRIVQGLAGGQYSVTSDQYSARSQERELAIALGTVVKRIDYSGAVVKIQTNRGEMTADFVIVTVPLGVLQNGHLTFNPTLPAAKREAIRRLGMGNYEKIALKFPHTFWPLEPQWFTYLGHEATPLYAAWLNIAHFTGQPILVATHAGSRARRINRFSDEALIAGCLETLRLMFGPDVPEPVAYVRTGWETDPFSLGSYSYYKVGSQAGDRLLLGGSVNGRLFFAGEATHPRYFGTVHGAYETGVRAAWDVLATADSQK
jgi:monoamine oxidase